MTLLLLRKRLALTRGAQKILSEKLALDLTLVLIGKRDDMHSKLAVLYQLRVIVGLNVGKFNLIWLLSRVDHRFNIVFQLLHNILVLQLLNIVVFPLHVGVEKAASLENEKQLINLMSI